MNDESKEGKVKGYHEYLKQYAHLLVELGVALQPGEYLILEAEPENIELVRVITQTAMEKGAKDVLVFLRDEAVDKYRALYGEIQEISAVREWQKESLSYYLERGGVSLLLKSPHPDMMKDVPAQKTEALFQNSNNLRNVIRSSWTLRDTRWCIACAPNLDWAKCVYPQDAPEKAYEKLFYTLMEICRVDLERDPVENWKEFLFSYYEHSSFMNRHKFDRLHFYGNNGTDFTVGFHADAFWVGGSDRASWNEKKNLGNIPTNEVSTSPDKYRMDGTVYSTRPLLYGGGIIDSFYLVFKQGKVIEAHAEVGQELLDKLLDTDEGSRRLGEIAFVEYDSPVARCNKVFYTTLLDENASCHMALGNGFSVCIPGLDGTDPAACEAAHLNSSVQHIDFMFGFEGLNADGYTRDGKKYSVFRNGKFAWREEENE